MTITRTETAEGSTLLGTGIRMHHVDQGDPQGEPLVLIHGFTDSSYSFSQLMPLLDPGYRVHAVDLRGHGATDRPDEGYGIDALADDVVAFLDALGIARATLVAHSLGTVVARRVAEARPERVERLVLIGSARTPVNEGIDEFREAVAALEEEDLPQFAREFQVSTLHASMPDGFLDNVVATSQAVPLPVWRAVIDGLTAFDDDAAVAGITAPTLLVWGEHDAIFGREEQEWLADQIPQSRLHVFAGTGHNPHWEIPGAVADAVQAFLAEH